PGFIIRFIKIMNKHNLEILTGLTSSKRPPYMSTQYHKLEFPINRLENTVVCKKPMDKITQVEASGPVGMLIKTSVFDKLKYPYYHVVYEKDKDGNDNLVGGDIEFCRKLKAAGIPIFVDLRTSFPHGETFFLNRGKILPKSYAQIV